jgi:hypothetical protein
MRSRLVPAQPGDLREVHYQLLAISHLLENKSPEEIYRFDSKQLSWGLGRILEELALELDEIADNWERWSLRGDGGKHGKR